jgi:F-type H+-transporting ATPase subunit k
MLTLATIGGGSALSMGGSKTTKAQGPPLNAQSPDEESFIKYVYRLADVENAGRLAGV